MAKERKLEMGRGFRWKSTLIRTGNRLTDRLMGIRPDEILNPGDAPLGDENPAQVLLKAAKTLKAEVVDPETGLVDYAHLAICNAYQDFREVARSLANCNIGDIGDRDQQMAFWINLYNTMILDAVVQYQITGSLSRQISFFRRAAYHIGGMRFSADDIEHGVLRGNRHHPALPFPPFAPDDPRLATTIRPFDPLIHFTLVCGARSCPPIAFYKGDHLKEQLNLAAASFIKGDGVRYDRATRTLWLSKIFQWYGPDFGGRSGILKTIRLHLGDREAREIPEDRSLRMRYMPYDWSLNALI
jgi:hypothetical protein